MLRKKRPVSVWLGIPGYIIVIIIVNFADTDEAVESGFYLARLSLIGS